MADATLEVGKQIYVAFNRLPGGQICTQHFETYIRQRKVGDQTQDIVFRAEDQLAGFRQQDEVAINVNGKITRHEVLIYDLPDALTLARDPRGAQRVTEWAIGKGLRPIVTPSGLPPSAVAPDTDRLAARVATLETTQQALLGKLDQLLAARVAP